MKILLQHKIFVGYILLMAIIGSMVAIVLHERNRVQKIEDKSITIFQTQHDINTAHRYVTALVTYGESILVWDNEDTLAYRKCRVHTDSMLQVLRVQCEDFIRPVLIDSFRILLAAKEEHLFQIMEASRKQRQTDSLLFNQKPTVTIHTTTKTVTRKKKGIASVVRKPYSCQSRLGVQVGKALSSRRGDEPVRRPDGTGHPLPQGDFRTYRVRTVLLCLLQP